jgi:hypothetical protein
VYWSEMEKNTLESIIFDINNGHQSLSQRILVWNGNTKLKGKLNYDLKLGEMQSWLVRNETIVEQTNVKSMTCDSMFLAMYLQSAASLKFWFWIQMF